MTNIVIAVEGMSCQHCVMRVKRAVEGLAGVKDLSVSIGEVKVTFDESVVRKEDIEVAIVKSGYKIKPS